MIVASRNGVRSRFHRHRRGIEMESERFDQLTRRINGLASRRAALAALGALGAGVARGESIAASHADKKKPKQCSKTQPCPACQTCSKKHHKCKPAKNGTACAQSGTCQSGACVCPTGTYDCPSADTCCANGTTCTGAATCGVCPAGDVCGGATVCGQWGPDPTQDVCACITSVQNTTVCASNFGDCFACTTDAECTTHLGVPAVCVDLSNCPGACDGNGQPDTNGRLCSVAACEDFSESAATARHGRQHGLPRVRGFGPAR
jgi:hypothetical protein